MISTPSQVIDRLFGYDVFIAHRRIDAAAYAALLVQCLDQEKLSTFIDQREYGPGDELSVSTLRHIRKATMLVVLGSPATREPRNPDWVLGEIEAYWAANEGEALRVLPIDFGGALATASDESRIAHRLRDVIRLDQPLEALNQPPSSDVIAAIARQFRNRRRDTVRLRVFQGVAGLLSALLLASLAAGWLANRALNDARRNLATNYLTAAKARLDTGFRDEAAALAAESLRHFDTAEARRLVTENPPLDLSQVVDADKVSGFAADVDLPRHRWVGVGFEGQLSLLGLDGKSRSDVRLGKTDLWAVRFTPEGERVIAGDEDGQMHVRAVSDLNQSSCGELPRLDGRISSFEFLPAGLGLLVKTGRSIYAIDFKQGCPSGLPRQIYHSDALGYDFVFDAPRQRIVAIDGTGFSLIPLSEGVAGPARHFTLPLPPGRSERLQPDHIAIQPSTGKLCVQTLGGEELIFLDADFVVTEPLAQRPFGTAGPSFSGGQVLAFDKTGERLAVSDAKGNLVIWSMMQGHAQRRLRVHEGGATNIILRDNTIVSLGDDRSGQVLRVLSLDPPSSMPVQQVHSLETPTQGWSVRSADGQRIAFFDDHANVEIRDLNDVQRKTSLIEQSPTGLHAAVWLDDGSAVAIGGGWAAPFLLPADPDKPVLAGPFKINDTVQSMVAGPDARVVIHAGATWVWDTRKNLLDQVDLVGKDSLALMNIAPWGRNGIAALTRNGLFLWHWTKDGRLERAAEVNIRGDRMVMSSDGHRVALFQRDRLAVYDLPSGALRAILPFAGDVSDAAFSEKMPMLLGGSRDAPFVLWSLAPLDAPPGEVADAIQQQSGRVNADFTIELPPPAARHAP
nr:toll/interleukin-1 receptor domain-containing protein [Pseudomonas akapageensis]